MSGQYRFNLDGTVAVVASTATEHPARERQQDLFHWHNDTARLREWRNAAATLEAEQCENPDWGDFATLTQVPVHEAAQGPAQLCPQCLDDWYDNAQEYLEDYPSYFEEEEEHDDSQAAEEAHDNRGPSSVVGQSRRWD